MKKSKKKLFISLVIIVLIVLTVASVVLLSYDSSATQNLHISIDAGVSYDINISPENKIKSIEPIDYNSLELLNGIEEIKGLDYADAFDKLFEAIIYNGYISQNKNTVLISIEKPYENENIEGELSQAVFSSLNKKNIKGCILSHFVTITNSLKNVCTTYNISFGKSRFINRILKQDIRYSLDELSRLIVNDLNIISVSGDLQLENVGIIGDCDKSGFITKEDAINEAITNAKIWASDAQSLECSLIVENKRLVYNVLFIYDSFLYEYEIDAKSGAMLFFEKTTDVNLLNESNTIQFKNEPSKENKEAYELMLIVANHAGIEVAHITDYYEVLNSSTNTYNISFNCDGYSYNYSVDANTHEIPEYNKKKIYTNNGAENPFTITKNQNGFIGADNVALIVFNHAGISYTDVINCYCKICKQRGLIYYELDFEAFSSLFRYLVNAQTGEIIKYEKFNY